MNRDLTTEYLHMLDEDLPDLWGRISAALPEKQNTAAAEPAKPVTADFRSLDRTQANQLLKRTRIYKMAGIAAAAVVCVAIAIPIALRISSQNSAAPVEMTAATAEEKVIAEEARPESAAGEAPEFNAAAQLFDSNKAAAFEEEAIAGGADISPDDAGEAIAEEAAFAEEAPEEDIEEAAPEAAAMSPTFEANVLLSSFSEDANNILTAEAVLQQDLPQYGLSRGDTVVLTSDADTPARLIASFRRGETYDLTLAAYYDEEGLLRFLIRAPEG